MINQIILGDCLEVMKQIPDGSVDMVLTDPPYGIDKKFKGGLTGKMNFNSIVMKEWDKVPTKKYFDEIFRISKNQIIWGGNYFNLPPTRCFIVWDKKISFDFSLAMCEMAWTSFDKLAKIYRLSSDKKDRIHPTQKPLKLFEKCLIDYSNENDLILDCFSGSGTTAIACTKLKRKFICIEKDQDYHAMSVKRLEEHKRQGVLI